MDQKFPLIKIKDLSKEYQLGDNLIKALDSVNLEIERGEFISILGKSGSGKSTLMHIIGLLDHPTSGEILFDNQKIKSFSDDQLASLRADKIGFIFQSFNLLARTSALDNVLLPSLYSKNKKAKKIRALELLKRVDLESRTQNMPNQLSGGQQQRVAIARSLINDPFLILADEPTGNLDSRSSEEILNLLKELNSDGKTVVIVTHDDSIADFTNRTIRISDGKIVEDRRK